MTSSVTISLPLGLASWIDATARREGVTISSFIRGIIEQEERRRLDDEERDLDVEAEDE